MSGGPHAQERGFSLVEILVAVIILSFGVLGAVGLQAAAIKSNRETRSQAVAVQLARELADMLRGNRAIAATLTADDNPYLGSFAVTGGATMVPKSPSYCLGVGGSGCQSPTEVARAQMTEWLSQVSTTLPTARVVTCFDNSPYDDKGVGIWSCSEGTNAPFVIKIGWTRAVLDKSLTGTAAIELAGANDSKPAVVVAVTP